MLTVFDADTPTSKTHKQNRCGVKLSVSDPYRNHQGIHIPRKTIQHQEDAFWTDGFKILRAMQEQHFWYRGRHRFLFRAFQAYVGKHDKSLEELNVVDVGGGCGGWISYLLKHSSLRPAEVALADSSLAALGFAAEVLPEDVRRYQVDVLDIHWREKWDVVFLLDVLEHIPDHERALREVYASLKPGGIAFVTTPALQRFWTWNDEAVDHVRRYSKADFRSLSATCGFELLDARYFMFFLSPLLLLSRYWSGRRARHMTTKEQKLLLQNTHRVPAKPINALLNAIFAAETPVGHHLPFPWGTSVLAVLKKPAPAMESHQSTSKYAMNEGGQ